MSDIGTLIDFTKPVISTASLESIGGEIASVFDTMTGASTWNSANQACFIPVKIGYPFATQKMFWINGATVGTNSVDVGIYDSQGNRLASSGSTTTSGASAVQSVSVSVSLKPGLYYFGFVMNGTTDTVIVAATASNLPRAWGVYFVGTSFPLPSTATFAGGTSSKIPFVAMTGQSIV